MQGYYSMINDSSTENIIEDLVPMFSFMFTNQVIQLSFFLYFGIRLIQSLKQYSLETYKKSKCKIFYYLMNITYQSNDFEKNYLEFKLKSLFNDDALSPIISFIYVFFTDFLPMITFQLSLLMSYRNNSRHLNKQNFTNRPHLSIRSENRPTQDLNASIVKTRKISYKDSFSPRNFQEIMSPTSQPLAQSSEDSYQKNFLNQQPQIQTWRISSQIQNIRENQSFRDKIRSVFSRKSQSNSVLLDPRINFNNNNQNTNEIANPQGNKGQQMDLAHQSYKSISHHQPDLQQNKLGQIHYLSHNERILVVDDCTIIRFQSEHQLIDNRLNQIIYNSNIHQNPKSHDYIINQQKDLFERYLQQNKVKTHNPNVHHLNPNNSCNSNLVVSHNSGGSGNFGSAANGSNGSGGCISNENQHLSFGTVNPIEKNDNSIKNHEVIYLNSGNSFMINEEDDVESSQVTD
ncbi:UNKNOWN [Stylonychia lemnae]|uniref:Transmembrane protein n=1 Tax=Stylonychia lemnae TaxID=5949 RepID=A0A078BA44_STYLE|nr:UNKNOWN [Stylonychia lemnae]|eukprot:CDW90388.1 UNKNOWN [Stylonychia lemnae]